MTENILEEFAQKTILVVGDIMLDRYVYGSIDRVSPEAPVPVLKYRREELKPGGAANAACNIASLGARTLLCGTAGDDDAGEQLDTNLRSLGLEPLTVTLKGRLTTVKTRIVAQQNHQIARIDKENTAPVGGAGEKELKEKIQKGIDRADGVLVADYAKGVVTPAVCSFLIEKANEKGIPVLIDPKGRDYSKYSGATVIKPNVKEFEEVADRTITNDTDAHEALLHLVDNYNIRGAVLTRGSLGMSIIDDQRKAIHIPSEAQEVYDVSGAGDTVAATLTLALSCGYSLFEGARIANTAASIVVSHAMTVAVTRPELEKALAVSLQAEEKKIILELDELKKRVETLKALGKKVVFTNGCFDLLHYGHVRYLQHARLQGDFLVVAINADETVKKLKGEGRPVIPQEQRAHLLASLLCVDAVTVFYEDKPLRYLEELKPDVLVKGSDYTRDGVVGHEIVDSYGGEIYLAPLEDGWSTSSIIERISKSSY